MSSCGAKALVLAIFCLVLVNSDEVNRRRASHNEASSRITYPNDFLIQQEPELHYHHHQHPPGYHRHKTYEEFPFVGESEGEKEYYPQRKYEEEEENWEYSNSSLKIPISFIRNINQYNVSDLLLNFVEDEPTFIRNRFGDEDDDGARNSAKIPKAAGCIPEQKTIRLAESKDPSILYIPQCTRVERCGGCCSHALLSCQPKETETLTYQVMKTQYTGGKKLKYLGKEVVLIEKHVSCKCDCKIKEEDCNKYQEYRESECRCACTNIDEEKKCNKNSNKKLWNPELCACQCKDMIQCTTGYSFDQIDCQCVPTPVKRRFASYDRRGYVSQAEPVVPLEVDDN